MHAMFVGTVLLLAVVLAPSAPPEPGVEVADEARRLFEQPLASFEDVCEVRGDAWIRHVRFATLDSVGQVEDRLELRATTPAQGSTPVLEYLVDGVVVFSEVSSGELRPTAAGLRSCCLFGFVAVLVIAVALVMLDVQGQRVLVVVPLVLGLLAIACSHFMRFAFITRKQTAALADDAEGAAVQAENGGDMEAIERSDIDVKSRILRRAMP